jgi:peroxiredoxin Q/BCP
MKRWFAGMAVVASLGTVQAAELKVNDAAPQFQLKNQAGETFDLKSRSGQWTVLYFYPKADTPGCTKQACAFRDNIKKIRAEGAEVYGISADSVEKQASFHKEQKLNFDLLADPDAKVIEQYGTKMPMMSMSKRWTFIVNPELKIASIDKDVDPVVDSEKIAGKIAELKKKK